LLVRGSVLPLRGYAADRPPRLGTGRINPTVVGVCCALGAGLIAFRLNDNWLSAVMVWLSVSIILLSLVVVVGYAGQLSLAQYAIAGMGALIAARLVEAAHWTFVPAMVAGVAGAAIVGLLFALPALNTRGVELAVMTLGLAVSADALLFNNASITASATGTPVGSPQLFGLNIDAFDHPVRYALMTLVAFALSALAVANLRRGRSGRRLTAIRTNERAAAAMGISVFEAKLHAFAVGGALAGLGGVLLSFQSLNVIYTGFNPFASISAVAEAVIGGVGYIAGPLVGGTLEPGSVNERVLTSFWAKAPEYLPLIGGVGLIVTLLLHRDGVAHAMSAGLRRAFGDRLRGPSKPMALSGGAATRVTAKRLQVEDLRVRYGGVIAVDGVSLTLEPGQILGLIGPNGAGKTSVIDAVSGFARAQGAMTLAGEPIHGWPAHERARAGLVRSFQSLELFEDMTVLENLQTASDLRDRRAMVTDLVRPGRAALPSVAVAAITEFRLESVLDRLPPEISYGQRRLVAIARAVAMGASVLLLDEPAAGLDDAESRELADLVRRLADVWGFAVLVVEHDMNFVMGVCDRLLVMDFGRPIASGTPAEVRNDPVAIAAYLGVERNEAVGAL
jgi:sulfate-transporting ATPase